MSQIAELASPADFDAWRRKARALLAAAAPPDAVVWRVAGETAAGDLFAAPASHATAPLLSSGDAVGTAARVPKAFLDLGADAICHRTALRFGLLYRLLWRLQREAGLVHIAADIDVHQLTQLVKAVRRDKHKMTAFVRFREVDTDDGPHYLAWFEPEHHILDAVTPFFIRRFAGMRWSILTPDGSAHWDGHRAVFGPGAQRADVPADDALEHHWRTYYASIFNPARLNTRAMKREMPVRYWHNLPEALLIPDLVRTAAKRTETMLQASAQACPAEPVQGSLPAAASVPVQIPASLEEVARGLGRCRRCDLWRCATRAVAGEGPANAGIVMVGEQPGDQEDLQGRPFVGPAGEVLNHGLAAAGLPRSSLYLTNAVKHFKFLPRGKRRLHQKPTGAEVMQCRLWLRSELELIRPKLIVALGATAASALLGRPVKISESRGRWLAFEGGAQLFITVHPSYLLRLKEPQAAEAEKQRFHADLAAIRQKADMLGIAGLASPTADVVRPH